MSDNVVTLKLAAEVEYHHAAAINLFAADCHAASRRAGWYTDLATGRALDRNVPEMLCLIHSEISEAMEGYRKSKPGKVLMDDKLPHRPMAEVELADAMIRIGDLAAFLDTTSAAPSSRRWHSMPTAQTTRSRTGSRLVGRRFDAIRCSDRRERDRR